MKRPFTLISPLILLMIAFLMQSCENITSKQEIEKLRDQSEKLRGDIDALRQSVKSQSDSIRSLEADGEFSREVLAEHSGKLLSLEDRVKSYNSRIFDFGDKTHQRIDSQNGFFLVRVDDVKPTPTGVKVTLQMGNPFAASFTGLKLMAKWGKPNPTLGQGENTKKRAKDVDESEERLTQREFTFHQTLRGGAWTYIELLLPNTKIDEVRHLELSIETPTIALIDNLKD
jgi:hypothetical protein